MAQDDEKPTAAEKGKGKADDVPMSNGEKSDAAEKDGKKEAETKKAGEPVTEEELSEEDQQLKSDLEMLVERLKEDDTSLYKPSMDAIKNFIKTSTSSMTAVPKPLKFLRPHYDEIAALYDKWSAGSDKDSLADMLSVLGMTYGDEEKLETLKYRLLSNRSDDLGSWGHEYIRHLTLEIGQEYQNRLTDDKDVGDLTDLALSLVPYFLSHNAEADAVDLLSELEMIEEIPRFLDENTFGRVCLYMTSMVNLLTYPDDMAFLKTAHDIYVKYNKLAQAMVLAIRLNDHELIQQDLESTDDVALKKQLAFLIARQRISVELGGDSKDDQEIAECIGNTQLPNHFKTLAKELNILEPKVPEDIYKTHLESGRGSSAAADSAKHNLASGFVNAFVNAGFGTDKLMLVEGDQRPWVWKTKDDGMLSATASLGMLMQWDVEGSLDIIDRFQQASEDSIKAGALLAYGVVNSGVRMEGDPVISLLSDDEVLNSNKPSIRVAAIMGLGLSYAGSNREDLLDYLLPILEDNGLEMQLSAMAAVSLGMIFVGSSNHQVAEAIATQMMDEVRQKQLKDKWARFMALGLALLYFGRQEEVDVILDILKAVDHPMSLPTATLASVCAWAGTGAVLKLQDLLHLLNDHLEDKEDNVGEQLVQSYSVLGLSLIAMGEDVGQEMILRQFGHLMHYGEANIRKAVPLAMGLISPSNPQMKIYDTLSRYSHDNDNDVAVNAIFAMGLVGAGTNNARLAQLLRQLASYYHRDQNSLFMVRIAQGLLHMGKGTMSLNPFHTDRQVLSRVAAAGLLTVLVSLIDAKQFILGDAHYLLYFLVTAMYPRFLVTLDEDLKPLTVNVRVGQAVDVVGQAGRPRTITGWQTQSTPVLLAYGERAELEDEEYICLSSTLEGLVILRKVSTLSSLLESPLF
jgi:26S proteasome regulatory subunit N1